jgi:hypothetical protein
MSGETVCRKCEWCGFTAPAVTDDVAEFSPEGWEFLDGQELCTGCVITRGLAIERAKAERKDINQNRGSAS